MSQNYPPSRYSFSRLHPFSSGTLAKVFDTEESTLAPEKVFDRGAHIVNLGLIETDEAKNLLSQVLCKKVVDYGRKLGPTKGLRFVLVVDEAHHLTPHYCVSSYIYVCEEKEKSRVVAGESKVP